MKEDSTLKAHIGKINSICVELHDIFVKVEDECGTMILLGSFPHLMRTR